AIGIHMTGLYFGQALGGFGATVAAAYTWHFTFHSFGIIGIVYSLVLVIFLREKKDRGKINLADKVLIKEKTSVLKGLALLFSNISFWIILFYFAIPSLPGWATKNWLPTLFSQVLDIPMSKAGPISIAAIAIFALFGVIFGGILSDCWVQKNVRGRVYTSAIGLGLTIPSLLLLGFAHTRFGIIGAAIAFGFGFLIFDCNNMPILCQFVSSKYRATAYGIMNMVGVFAGAFITDLLGKSSAAGNLGKSFAILGVIVLIALIVQISFLRPKVNNYVD